MGGSLFNAIVSGRSGIAFLTDGPAVYSLGTESNELIAHRPEEYHMLLGGCRDFEFIEDGTCDEITDCLSAAVRREGALDVALILLDDKYDQDIRREAAEELDDALADDSVAWSLDCVMYSVPLPRGTDVTAAETVVPQNCPRASHWLERLRQLQPVIRMVYEAWSSLSDEAFSPSDREDAEAACVRAGGFRQLTLSVESDGNLGKAFVSLIGDAGLGRRVPHAVLRKLLPAWQSALRGPATALQDSFDDLAGESDEYLDPDSEFIRNRPARSGRGGRGFDRVAAGDKANEQVARIAAQLKAGNLAMARHWIDDLVRWHETMHQGAVFACKSLCNLAVKAQELSLFDVQLEITRRAVDLNPNDSWAWRQHGHALLNCGKLHDALSTYDRVRREHPRHVVAQNGRAEVLKAMGRFPDALEAYDQVRREHPENVVAQNGRAEVLKAMGRFSDALEAFDQLRREHPEDVVAQTGRAEVLKAMGRFSDALEAYDQVRREHPKNVVAQNGRAEVLKAMGRFPDALEAYDQARREHPEDVVAQTGRAEVLKAIGRFPDALEAYDQVRREHPEDVVAQTGRAEVLKAMGRFPDALEAYDRVRREHPDNQVARNGLANLLADLGRYSEALSLIADTPVFGQEGWIAKHLRGMIHLRQGAVNDAAGIFERGAKECPFARSRTFFLTALATTKLLQEDYAAAEATLATLDDDYFARDSVESIRMHVLGVRGDFDRAAISYQRLNQPTTEIACELFDELRRRFVDRQPAVHPDDWLFDRQIRFQLLCLSMAA